MGIDVDLKDLLQRSPPTTHPCLFRGARAAIRQQEDPPPPPHQFAVWVAQREGQRSNKCHDVEVLSHGNVITHMSASIQEERWTKTCDGGQVGITGVWWEYSRLK